MEYGGIVHIAYYITAHGYGHGVRASAICNAFSRDVRLSFVTGLPESFLSEEIQREFRYRKAEFDCGCLQTDGVTVDIQRTLGEYMCIADRNKNALAKEVRWLKDEKIDGVVADITPFAFEAAASAGIPSVAVTNFTWYDIYLEYLAFLPEFRRYLDHIRNQYSMCGLLCALSPALPMDYFPIREDLPVVGRSGIVRRPELAVKLGIDRSKKIGLIYAGSYGMNSVEWKRLESFAGWEFLGLYPLPENPSNYHIARKNDFRYQDLSASVDLVIGKIGYGTYAESVIHGTPIMFLPRKYFAEYTYLERALLSWGGGYVLPAEEFCALDWGSTLAFVSGKAPAPPKLQNGAPMCAGTIESFIRRSI